MVNGPALMPEQDLLQAAWIVTLPDHEATEVPIRNYLPNALNMPPGCPFQTRCLHAEAICRREKPALQEVGNGHLVACHRPLPLSD